MTRSAPAVMSHPIIKYDFLRSGEAGFKRWFTETRSQHFGLNIHKQNPPPLWKCMSLREPQIGTASLMHPKGRRKISWGWSKPIKSKPKQSGSLSLPVACDHFNCFKHVAFGPPPFGVRVKVNFIQASGSRLMLPIAALQAASGQMGARFLQHLHHWTSWQSDSNSWNHHGIGTWGFLAEIAFFYFRSLFPLPLPWSWQEAYPIIQSILSIGKTQDVGIQTKIAQIKSWAHWLW